MIPQRVSSTDTPQQHHYYATRLSPKMPLPKRMDLRSRSQTRIDDPPGWDTCAMLHIVYAIYTPLPRQERFTLTTCNLQKWNRVPENPVSLWKKTDDNREEVLHWSWNDPTARTSVNQPTRCVLRSLQKKKKTSTFDGGNTKKKNSKSPEGLALIWTCISYYGRERDAYVTERWQASVFAGIAELIQ